MSAATPRRVLTAAAGSPVTPCDTSESSWPPGAKDKCSWEAGGTISYTSSGQYTPKRYIQFCGSEACMGVIAAMKTANPSECVTTVQGSTFTIAPISSAPLPPRSTFLYADILTPIENGCKLVSTPSTVASNAPPAPLPTAAASLPSRKPGASSPSTRQPNTASSATSEANTTGSGHTDTAMNSESIAPTADAPTAALPEWSARTEAPTTSSASWSTPSSGSASESPDAPSTSRPRPQAPDKSNAISVSAASTSNIASTLIVVLVGTALIVVMGVIVLFLRRQRRQKNTKSVGDGYSSTDTHESASVSAFNQHLCPVDAVEQQDPFLLLKPLGKWRIDSTELKDVSLIGGGGQGAVYLVRLNASRLLASKRLISTQTNQRRLSTLVAEAQLVATLQHVSIVAFVGVAWTTPSSLQVLFEYMANGDVRGYLDRTKPLPQQTRAWTREKLQIAFQVAGGLVYAHSFMSPIVHRDLKAKNVLLDDDMNAKISGFGVARSRSEDCTMTTGIGSSRWMAPEVITVGGEYTERCDIYAFGVLMSELDTHELPYAESSLSEVLLIQQVVQGTLRPRVTPTCDPAISELIQQCLQADPLERPNALRLSFRLRQILKSKLLP